MDVTQMNPLYSDPAVVLFGGRVFGTYETCDGREVRICDRRLHNILKRMCHLHENGALTPEKAKAFYRAIFGQKSGFTDFEKYAAAEIIGLVAVRVPACEEADE